MNIYLDHNATTPLRPVAVQAVHEVLTAPPGNASSIHDFGQRARAVVDRGRAAVRRLLHTDEGRVLFTGSGTEAVLTALLGATAAMDPPGHAVISAIEHRVGLDAIRLLQEAGWRVTPVRPDAAGVIHPAAVAQALQPDTGLVSVLQANNETGVVQPVGAIAGIAREAGALFHVDAVQSAGKLPVTARDWGADLVSVAAHKLGGPAGVGALWRREDVRLAPLLPGSQEDGLRGGTHNVPGIAGFTAAIEASLAGEEEQVRLRALRETLETQLRERVPECRVTGGEAPRLSNTTHLTFDPSVGADLVWALDLEGIAVSSGSACASGSEEPSHVLLAMGMDPGRAATAVRVSTGWTTTERDLDLFLTALERVLAVRRVPAPGRTP